jgi:hypothetical protein
MHAPTMLVRRTSFLTCPCHLAEGSRGVTGTCEIGHALPWQGGRQ